MIHQGLVLVLVGDLLKISRTSASLVTNWAARYKHLQPTFERPWAPGRRSDCDCGEHFFFRFYRA